MLRCQAELRVEQEPRVPNRVTHGHGDLSTNGSAASVGNGSLPETTSTERVFRTVPGGELGVDAFFKKVETVGRRERWFISPDDVQLLPHLVLGRGGFGIAAAGAYFRSQVAVKIASNISSG